MWRSRSNKVLTPASLLVDIHRMTPPNRTKDARHAPARVWDLLLGATSVPTYRALSLAIIASLVTLNVDWLTSGDFRVTLGFIVAIVTVLTWVGHARLAFATATLLVVGDTAISAVVRDPTWMSLWWGFASSLVLLTLGIILTRSFRNVMLDLNDQAQHDSLTGLLNTQAFQQVAEIERTRAVRTGEPITIAFLDLDSFKQINDVHGHVAGDAVLRTFADCIAGSVRPYDIVGRVGGDEFTLVLPNTDQFAAAGVVERIRHRVAALNDVPTVTATMGLVTFTFPPATVQDMIRAADELMYQAKRNHTGGITLGRVADGSGKDEEPGQLIEIEISVHEHGVGTADPVAVPPRAAAR